MSPNREQGSDAGLLGDGQGAANGVPSHRQTDAATLIAACYC